MEAAKLELESNTEVLKEPRGFIKFIQIILAIFAFATASGYYSSTAYEVTCNDGSKGRNTINFGYPFRLNENKLNTSICNGSSSELKPIYGDYSAPSQFFVFVGVTAFLYCLGTLIFYVMGDHKYRTIELIPVVDFIVTLVYGALWLIASAAWADGVAKIKHYTDPQEYFDNEYSCECFTGTMTCAKAATCNVTDGGNYATINVSVMFGFLCMCVWVGNLWFLYKETKWFKSNQPPMQSDQPTSEPQQRI